MNTFRKDYNKRSINWSLSLENLIIFLKWPKNMNENTTNSCVKLKSAGPANNFIVDNSLLIYERLT